MALHFKFNRDKFVEIDGVTFQFSDQPPTQPGEIYIAERNTGPKLLTVREVNEKDGFIVPKEMAYCYNTNECRKVVRML